MKRYSDTPAVREALQAVDDAWTQFNEVVRRGDIGGTEAADHHLRHSILLAIDAGASWGMIGSHLDLNRGNAYSRYRRKAQPRRADTAA